MDRGNGLIFPVFARAYELVTGHTPEDFHFTPGRAVLATESEVLTILVLYYTIVFGGRELMKSRDAIQLTSFFKIHNFYLTIISGLLLILHIEQIIPTLWSKGIFFSVCRRDGGWKPPLESLYYLNYLTKYLELLDTVFLVLRKKQLTILHTYHHGATAFLCYTQLAGRTPVSWVPITLNLTVHVVMYWYYFQASRGVKIWWKQYITVLQILQFVLDLSFIYFAFWTESFSSMLSHWNFPNWGRCEGDHWSAWWGFTIITSYLFLFIGFYVSTYKTKLAKNSSQTIIFGMRMW